MSARPSTRADMSRRGQETHERTKHVIPRMRLAAGAAPANLCCSLCLQGACQPPSPHLPSSAHVPPLSP
nr:hypothetical protein HmN_000190400 [Hymenolepis microstoma]